MYEVQGLSETNVLFTEAISDVNINTNTKQSVTYHLVALYSD
jgi:hypothetical protein